MSAPTRSGAPSGRRIRGLDAEERAAQRRQQVLDAALEHFGSRGFVNTSIEQLCQRAYVSTKSFYELFASKEACYLELHAELTRAIADRMLAEVGPEDLDALERARRLIATLVHAFVDDPRVARVVFLEGVGISETVDRQRRDARRWGAEFIEMAWRLEPESSRAPAGSTARPNIRRLAHGLIGGILDVILDWLLDPEPDDLDVLVADLVDLHDLVYRGLAEPATERSRQG
jgi:AcrR family transcriptional regulator